MSFTTPQPVFDIISNPLVSRDDAIKLLHDLLVPVYKGMSRGHGRVRIGHTGAAFDHVAAEMEGYCRALWGLAPILAVDPDRPELQEMANAWADGLANATDPEHEDYWGVPPYRNQRYVELAAIAFAILIAPKSFWDPLSDKAKDDVVTYLAFINRPDVRLARNNWTFFRVLVNAALRSVGRHYPSDQLEADFAFIETFYGDHGFPSDGVADMCRGFDYYATSFAIPFYSLIYSKICGHLDPARAAKFRERALMNIEYLPHLFAPDGKAIPFGRSMTYRFAVASFWSAWAYDKKDGDPAPLPWGVIKGLVFRNIRSFTQQESVFNRDGGLSIGWNYPNMFLSEASNSALGYNSPQSPYWALKAFLFLALPAEHPFWSAKEEPYPTQWLEKPFTVVKPWYQVLSHAAGHTFAMTAGQHLAAPQRGITAKYGKFAYSGSFGFSMPAGPLFLKQHAPDSVLALSDDVDGERWMVPRILNSAVVADDGVIKAVWSPWPDVTSTTWIIPPQTTDSAYYIRVTKLVTQRPLQASDAGWAIHSHDDNDLAPSLDAVDPAGSAGLVETPHAAVIYSKAGAAGVVDVLVGTSGKATCMHLESSTNVIDPWTGMATVLHEVPVGETWMATAVFGVPAGSQDGKDGWVQKWRELEGMAGQRSVEELLAGHS